MAIIVGESKKLIIDKSLIEMFKRKENIESLQIEKYIELLKKVAVDFVEINSSIVEKIGKMPAVIDYVFRVNEAVDTDIINKFQIKYVVIDYETALNFDLKLIKLLKNYKVILELEMNELDNLFLDENNEIFHKMNISSIRIKNIEKYDITGFDRIIKSIKIHFGVMVDICADNKYNMATAVSVEACMDGVDFITVAFNGGQFGLASLEEVLMALKVTAGSEIYGELRWFNELSNVYELITETNIYSMKPILGADIFKYESGIHADGIEKNPKTYELYSPEDIGQERKLYIGKHSGKKAVMIKLKELNVEFNDYEMNKFLDIIRYKSIELRRNILDEELIELYSNFNKGLLQLVGGER